MAPRDFKTRLLRRAAKSGLFLPDELADRLIAYYELLSRWNRKINLTALDNPDEAIDRLLLEPVLAVRHFPADVDGVRRVRIMDVGSGGGVSGHPDETGRSDFDADDGGSEGQEVRVPA